MDRIKVSLIFSNLTGCDDKICINHTKVELIYVGLQPILHKYTNILIND